MALGHGSSSSKKHRKSRREGSAEDATKPIKSFIQVFWRRHSSAAASNTEKPAESGTRTLSPSHKTSAPTVSSLEQALRIARGQVEEEVFPVANEQVNYQSPNAGFLPRIPEYGEGTYTAAQVERLKAGVVRRTNSRSDRSEFNSAPPGIYWPDGETTGAHPQTPHHQAPAFGPVDRLPRIAPLSRPTSSVFFGGPRSPVTSFCASPTRAVSPTPFLHRPLPPPPFADRRGDKMSKSFNLGATAGPMWRAVPLKSPTAELEVVDTAVYSNVKIPVLSFTNFAHINPRMSFDIVGLSMNDVSAAFVNLHESVYLEPFHLATIRAAITPIHLGACSSKIPMEGKKTV
ncbi:unnamed protein product [Mesocestoides corti]|uniref:Uncharacterized protein n=1 Tax=Mesocestoides corti TaxID=53468 RepID=A0A0R3U3K9_MESCO|nr:unnamed protein product [Mesocestoides corti]